MKNRVTVKILDNTYSLLTEESEEYTERIAKRVDDKIGEIMAENPQASIAMSAVMAALDFCDEALKAKEAADNLRTQLKDYLAELSEARDERDAARKESNRLYSELQTLKKRAESAEKKSE